MKIMFCWRCQTEMPMLDEGEYRAVCEVMNQCTKNVKQFRAEHNASLNESPIQQLFRPVRDKYEDKRCGKPLRTPEADFCAACGAEA